MSQTTLTTGSSAKAVSGKLSVGTWRQSALSLITYINEWVILPQIVVDWVNRVGGVIIHDSDLWPTAAVVLDIHLPLELSDLAEAVEEHAHVRV